MNYFIDEKALLLNDQNIFTAIELKTLIPVSGYNTLKQFTASNSWADEWIPQYEKETIKVKVENHSWVKRISEWLIDKLAGNNLDDFLFKLTTRRWKKKEQRHQRNRKGLPMKLITGKHFSKSDAGDFQEKVLRLHEEKMRRVLGSSALE